MAHVLNRKERTQAFSKFLLFFLLATAIIVAAVARFDAYVPIKENEVLRNELQQYKMQEIAQEKFVANLDETKQLFDLLDKPNSDLEHLKYQIDAKFNQLSNNMQYRDSTMYSRLYKVVLNVFIHHKKAIFDNLEMGNLSAKNNEYKAENKELREKLIQANDENEILRSRQSSNGF